MFSMKKGVEIELNHNGTEKKKHKISPFLVRWHAFEHRDGTTVHGKKRFEVGYVVNQLLS
jgi:hypothetical protein